jgi:hypothetical protein
MEWKRAGLYCVIIRQPQGHLCGYVGVPLDHKYYSCKYEESPQIEVHGGITYSKNTLKGRDDELWWFGFDCAHAFDLAPNDPPERFGSLECLYRDFEYVKSEVESMAKQLKEMS